MRYVRHVEDGYGSLVEILYYCCRLCYVEEPEAELAGLPGGWWPCLDSELDAPEACRVCGELIGPVPPDESDAGPTGTESRLRHGPDARSSFLRQRHPRPARDR